MTRQNQERGRKRVRKAMMVVLCSNVNGASVPILLVLIVHYMVQVSAPLLHHPSACSNLAVCYLVACCIWCLACIASNLVKLHLLTLHIIPLIMTCLLVFDTYYICLLTMFVHQTNALLYPSSITYDETVTRVGFCEMPYSFKECIVILPT